MQTLSTKPIPRAERLVEAAPAQRHGVVATFVVGGLIAVVELLLFDWDAGDTAGATLIGTSAWGAMYYLQDTAKLIPRGVLQEAPRDLEVGPQPMDLSDRLWLVALAALLVPFAWLLDRLEVSAAFFPGLPFGYGAASLIALVRIRRWERANGRRVLYDPDADSPRPYAGPPL